MTCRTENVTPFLAGGWTSLQSYPRNKSDPLWLSVVPSAMPECPAAPRTASQCVKRPCPENMQPLPLVSAQATPKLVERFFMSDEKTLTVEGFRSISLSDARRVAEALEAHERSQEFQRALEEREAYALATRASGQHTLGSLLEAAATAEGSHFYRDVRFDFGDAPSTSFNRDEDNLYLRSQNGACFWGEFLLALRQAEAFPTSALWYQNIWDVPCAISGVSLEDEGRLVILHTSYVRKGSNGVR